jgi:hypothetical protein
MFLLPISRFFYAIFATKFSAIESFYIKFLLCTKLSPFFFQCISVITCLSSLLAISNRPETVTIRNTIGGNSH